MIQDPKRDKFDFIFELDDERSAYVTDQLREFNRPLQSPRWANPAQAGASLQIYALDKAGTVVGGLMGCTNKIPEWLDISVLWVEEEQRGLGIGLRLMRLAEEEGRRRGCHYSRLATSDYQAPGFYHKLGYRVYGTLENCPRGETVYYFCKELEA